MYTQRVAASKHQCGLEATAGVARPFDGPLPFPEPGPGEHGEVGVNAPKQDSALQVNCQDGMTFRYELNPL
ncbi:hypothetical protein GCM10011504_26330 [Siccirubricoccus deserti]|nr:hypothetical protein GCM10011504_26330 [Siccirubricoccus deserti]